MDEAARQAWKWKFYRVALHLNAVILSVALTVLAALLAPVSFRAPAVAALLVIDGILIVTFTRNYRAAKGWLDIHGTAGKNE
jgi:hypothetical protein